MKERYSRKNDSLRSFDQLLGVGETAKNVLPLFFEGANRIAIGNRHSTFEFRHHDHVERFFRNGDEIVRFYEVGRFVNHLWQ